MIFVSIICSGRFSTKKIGSLNLWITTGCMLSCLALLIISILASGLQPRTPSKYCDLSRRVQWDIFNCSNRANDATGKRGRKKKRRYSNGSLGCLTNAFALGSLMGTVFSDLFGYLFQSAREGYATVFLLESAIFGLAVFISLKLKFVKQKALRMKNFFRSSSKQLYEIRG